MIPFYEKLGYRSEGPVFDEDGGESILHYLNCSNRVCLAGLHQKMVCDIAIKPQSSGR